MNKIDLHMHSLASDGKLSAKELIDWAKEKNIPAIAITDHDAVSPIKEVQEYSKNKNIELVPGIEITATPPSEVKELHIVGLFIDPENKKIQSISEKHKKYAINTAKKIIKNLNNLGYKITLEELEKETNGEHYGRPSIAKILMKKYPEKFHERKQVFDELLGKKGKAFVKAKGTSMKQAINIIHDAGGIAIIAHPWYLGENMKKMINKFANLKGDGIEVSCPKNTEIPANMDETLRDITKESNLIISGGTDFHEKDGKREIGDQGLTKEEFENLKNYHKNKQKP